MDHVGDGLKAMQSASTCKLNSVYRKAWLSPVRSLHAWDESFIYALFAGRWDSSVCQGFMSLMHQTFGIWMHYVRERVTWRFYRRHDARRRRQASASFILYMSHVNESCHVCCTYTRTTRMNEKLPLNEPRHRCSLVCMRVTCKNVPSHAYACAVSHVWNMYVPCHMYQCSMSHTWRCHVTHISTPRSLGCVGWIGRDAVTKECVSGVPLANGMRTPASSRIYLHICICLCICIYKWMHIHVYNAYICVSMYVCIYIDTHTHTYIHTYTRTYVHKNIIKLVCLCMFAHVWVHTYIHTHIHACGHKYTSTNQAHMQANAATTHCIVRQHIFTRPLAHIHTNGTARP